MKNKIFFFKTKAKTLLELSKNLNKKFFLKQEIVKIDEWKINKNKILSRIEKNFKDDLLAIRSSGEMEDKDDFSNAGVYKSFLNISNDPRNLSIAINNVIKSYQNDNAHEVLVQPMLKNVELSGVVLTKDIKNGTPYIVINYDDFSGKTDTVTGGAQSKSIYILNGKDDKIKSKRFKNLISFIKKIKKFVNDDNLDIEFCFSNNQLYILQVRKLVAQKYWTKIKDITFYKLHDKIEKKLHKYVLKQRKLKNFCLSNMADWNPAEMIGNNPKPLAISLYKNLITDNSWLMSRKIMGYKDLTYKKLMLDVSGKPYIDVNLSLNSLLPKNLDEKISSKILNDQINFLSHNKHLHDKIEFEIAFGSLDFNFYERRKKILESLTKIELNTLETCLKNFTNKLVKNGLGSECKTTLNRLPKKIDIFNIKLFFDGMKKFGTIPFSISARHAFISMSLLKSSKQHGIIKDETFEKILKSINTVAVEVIEKIFLYKKGKISKDVFDKFCGHLRPGTYDITMERYDQNPNLVQFTKSETYLKSKINIQDILNVKEVNKFNKMLNDFGFDFDTKFLLEYLKNSIILREENKFNFTKYLSNYLEAIADYGHAHELSRDDLSFLSTGEIIKINKDKNKILDLINARKKTYDDNLLIKCPDVIDDLNDLSIVRLPLGKPNFITNKKATGNILKLNSNKILNFDNKIMLLEVADPGFDWILSQPISGIITKYGGANSHIAIRCAEFGIPAAIGCGERLFNSLEEGNSVEINCLLEKIKVIS